MVFLDLLKNVGVLGQNLDRETDLLKQKVTGAIDPIAYEIAQNARQPQPFFQNAPMDTMQVQPADTTLLDALQMPWSDPRKNEAMFSAFASLIMGMTGNVNKAPIKFGRIEPTTYDINRGVTSENIGIRPEPVPPKLRSLEPSTGGVKSIPKQLEPLVQEAKKVNILKVEERPITERYLENKNLNQVSRDAFIKDKTIGNEVVLHIDKPMTEEVFNKYINTIKSRLPKFRVGFRERPYGLSPVVTQRVQADGTAKIYLNLNQATKIAKESGRNIDYNNELIKALGGEGKELKLPEIQRTIQPSF